MTALSAPRPATAQKAGDVLQPGVKAGSVIYAGGLVGLLGGLAVPASAIAGLIIIGRAAVTVDNSVGADAALDVRVERGVFRYSNSAGGDAITAADVGKACFAVDDATVAKTVGTGLRAVAGKIDSIDAQGVWVDTRHAGEGRKLRLPFFINETDTLAGTSTELISPVVGAITSMSVIVQKTITTGGPVTASVGVTAVVGLSCVIADGATKGTVVTDAPAFDATTVVAVGSRIQVTPDAAFNTAGAVSGFVEITY